MNQSARRDAQEYLTPFLNLTEIQMRTAQKLWQEQADLARECADVGAQYGKSSGNKQDSASFMRAPLEISQQVQQRLMSSFSRQWEILLEAREELGGVAESAGQNMKKTVDKAQKSMQEAAEQAQENMQDVQDDINSTGRKEATKSKRKSQ